MSRNRTSPGLVLGLACLISTGSMGQTQTSAPEPRFVVEISRGRELPPFYWTLYDGVSSSTPLYDDNLRRLPNADSSIPQPSALRLDFKVADAAVSITAIAFYGELDRQTTPASVEKLLSKPVGTYSGKLNDRVKLSGLEEVGLEPLTIRILSPQAESSYHPLTRSNAPSLTIDFAPVDRTTGMATVHNLSGKAVTAFQVGGSDERGGGWSRGPISTDGTDVIAPGATYQERISLDSSGRVLNGAYVQDPPPPSVILQAVLFADGGYEGDMKAAATMAARQIGGTVQHRRIQSVAEPFLKDDQLDDKAKNERMQAEVDQLSVVPSADMTERLRRQFPELSEAELADDQIEMSGSMRNEKETYDHEVKQFESNPDPDAHQGWLARWWSKAYGK